MESANWDRLRADQQAIRQAAGVDLPFGRVEVLGNVVIAGWALLLAVWATFVPEEPRWLLMAPVWLLLPILLVASGVTYRRRGAQPVAWREFRYSLIAGGVFFLAVLADRAWATWIGKPVVLGTEAGVFVIGLGVTITAVAHRNRISYLGIALPIMALGLALPWCDTMRQKLFVVGLVACYGALATSALQALRLRRERLEKTDANAAD